MKRNLIVTLIAAFLLIAPIIIVAQAPPHPNNGSAPSGTNTPVGAGAPVGNGIFILLTLASAYAGRKVYDVRCEKEVG
ncbi:MAG: hypothetical protein Q7U54_17015 [Bacteroidales bacterium]|nr:hypothetical protein [Bacteroidales bacterium]